MIVSLPASPWFYRSLNAALILVLAWLLAALFWLVISPRPTLPVAAPPLIATRTALADVSALNAWFAAPAPGGEMQPSTLNVKLRGVIATSTPAAAVFERSGQSALAVKTGEELESGVLLVEVAADHVVVDNHGRRERIELDSKPAISAILPADAPSPADTSNMIRPVEAPVARTDIPEEIRPAGRGVPPGRSGDERLISRQSLMLGMQGLNVNDWSRGLADAGGKGIVVQDAEAQPLAGLLGLQSGDVVKSVNGQPLMRKSDISTLYAVFSRTSQVNVEIQRSGTPMSLHYRVESQPAP